MKTKINLLLSMIFIMILLFSLGCEVTSVNGYYDKSENTSTEDPDNDYTIRNDINENQIDTDITIANDLDSSTVLKKDEKGEYISLYKQYWESIIVPTYGLLDVDNFELKRHGNMSAEEFIEREQEIRNIGPDEYSDLYTQANMKSILGFMSDKTIVSALIIDLNDDEVPELITTRLEIEKNDRDHEGLYLIMEIYNVRDEIVSLRSQHKSFDLFGIARTSYDIAIKSSSNGYDFVIASNENMQSYYDEKTHVLRLIDDDIIEKINFNYFSAESVTEYEVNDVEAGIGFTARSTSVSDINDWELTGVMPDGESWISIIDVAEYFSPLKESTLANAYYFMQIKISKTDPTSEFYLGQQFIGEASIITRMIDPVLDYSFN